MKVSQAIAQRILNLCNENNISINRLAILSGQTQSTVQSLVNGKSKNPKMLTIVRICDSLKIELKDFLMMTCSNIIHLIIFIFQLHYITY